MTADSMLIVNIVAAMFGFIATPVLLWYIRIREREHREQALATTASMHRTAEWHMRETANTQAIHAQAIATLHGRHAAEIERLTNLLTIGATARKEAVISSGEPDAEERILKRISEETIEAGTVALMAEYAERGIVVAAEEVRDEVISMIMGTPYTPNENISLVEHHPPEAAG